MDIYLKIADHDLWLFVDSLSIKNPQILISSIAIKSSVWRIDFSLEIQNVFSTIQDLHNHLYSE